MFDSLKRNLTKIFDKISSSSHLTENNFVSAISDIKSALLESDVDLQVVKDFTESLKLKIVGQEIIKSTSPAQTVIKIVNDEMVKLLSAKPGEEKLNLGNKKPANILMLGLQGSGKTTATAKLAYRFKKKKQKKVLMVSLDTYRDAAQEQLEILGKNISVETLEIIKGEDPISIARRADKYAKRENFDLVLYDSAGRLNIDEKMMDELREIVKIINPVENIVLVDAMIGQEALKIIRDFDEKINISSVIVSRIDGDARGGVVFSIRHSTGKIIKYLSTGEKPEDLEVFNPTSIASRILGMGDVVSLVEKAKEVIDKKEAENLAQKIKKGKFDLNDYISQIGMIGKFGGISKIASMLPGVSGLLDKMDLNKSEEAKNLFIKHKAIYNSMTKEERSNPEILNKSRQNRIAKGSGSTRKEVEMMMKKFSKISKTMKNASSMMNDPSIMDKLPSLKDLKDLPFFK